MNSARIRRCLNPKIIWLLRSRTRTKNTEFTEFLDCCSNNNKFIGISPLLMLADDAAVFVIIKYSNTVNLFVIQPQL